MDEVRKAQAYILFYTQRVIENGHSKLLPPEEARSAAVCHKGNLGFSMCWGSTPENYSTFPLDCVVNLKLLFRGKKGGAI